MIPQGKKINPLKYLSVFLFTAIIFGSGFLLSDYIAQKRFQQLDVLQQNLRTDILSLETQFSVLRQAPCDNLNESTLTKELYDVSQKLSEVSADLGEKSPYYLQLKKYYSIMEIQHWLLVKQAAKECSMPFHTIIYFYADKEHCPSCENQGYLLTYFREKYPSLRIYSFDFDLPLSALQALKSVFGLKDNLPVIVVDKDVYYGFKDKTQLEDLLGKYVNLESLEQKPVASSTPSSSAASPPAKNKK
ncbi:MAG: hypothetical protein M1127_01165 [Patescibacteria group bacterium]|nr:hypothetical protein [Patescibacteria group bacterium]